MTNDHLALTNRATEARAAGAFEEAGEQFERAADEYLQESIFRTKNQTKLAAGLSDLLHATVCFRLAGATGSVERCVSRGLEIEDLEAPDEQGFDIVAYDDRTDEYHIIEAKFRSTSGSVSNSSTWLDRPDKGPQMSTTWIEATIDELADSANPEHKELALKLESADDEGRI